jgi:hypothetical protein
MNFNHPLVKINRPSGMFIRYNHSVPFPSDDFLQWFVGFSDAEGNFLISIDREFVRFRFKISLHLDDIQVLKLIQSKLGVGSVTEENINYCSFVVQDFLHIKNIICPIFLNFPLQSNKRLDFKDFYQAILIKGDKGHKISEVGLRQITSLKNGLNLGRINNVDSPNADAANSFSCSINPNWFIGFIEGDGTFGIKNGSPYFQISQKNSSLSLINALKVFISSLPNTNYSLIPLSPPRVNTSINQKSNVISLTVNNIDSLYYFLLPFFDQSSFLSRKFLDFKLWRISLLLHKFGYYFLPEGRQLLTDISNNINNNRYSTYINQYFIPFDDLIKRSNIILASNPPFNINLGKTHTELSQNYSKSLVSKTVYIYKNNKLIEGSPFFSNSEAHKVLGLSSSSKICFRYIDTGKLYKNIYIISSRPLTKI